MSRLFTFGCSFTRYWWPTWADHLAQSYPESRNLAEPGSDNGQIALRISGAIQRYGIGTGDTVAVMWTDPGRENHYREGHFHSTREFTRGTSKWYLNKEQDPWDSRGRTIQTLGTIHLAQLALDTTGCTHYHTSMMTVIPVTGEQIKHCKGDFYSTLFDLERHLIQGSHTDHPWLYRDCVDLYQSVYSSLTPCANSLLYPQILEQPRRFLDRHPSPLEHLTILASTVQRQPRHRETRHAHLWQQRYLEATTATDVGWPIQDPEQL